MEERLIIEKSLDEIKRFSHLAVIDRKIEIVLKTYFLFGAVLAILGFSYFMLKYINIKMLLDSDQQIALMISGIGIFLSLTSFLLLIVRKERKKEELENQKVLFDFLLKWIEFESISRKILLEKGTKFNKLSIKDIIYHLLDENLIDKTDALILEEALQIRNMVVHTRKLIPQEIIIRYSKYLERIILKMLNNKFSTKNF